MPDPTLPLQQHPNFARALQALGRAPLSLTDGTLVLRRQIAGGLPLAMISRFRHDSSDIPPLLQDIRNSRLGRTPILLAPDRPLPCLAEIGALALMTPAHVAEIDLTPPAPERRARMHPKWRNRLVRSESSALQISCQRLAFDTRQPLFVIDRAQQRAQGYRAWPVALTLAYAKANPGQAMVFVARHSGNTLAEMLFLRHGAGATYHIGYTTPEGRRLGAHGILLWQASAWLAARGHTRLDLGLLDTNRAPGLARFKLGSGAQARPLGGTWAWWPPLGRILRPLAWLDRRAMTPPTLDSSGHP